jgi:hypothetical protein
VTFRGRCALVALPACSGHQGIYVGNEGLSMGCAPDCLAKCFWVLGRYILETFLRLACLEWLCQTPCSHAGYLGVSTLHMIKIDIVKPASSPTKLGHCKLQLRHLQRRRTFQDPAGSPRILGIIDLRPLRGRHAYKAFLRSALPDSLQPCWEIWVSLLFVRSKTMT